MTATIDPLLKAVGELEAMLATDAAARPGDWAERVERVLADVEQAVQQRLAAVKSSPGRPVKVDCPRLPSPAVERGQADLQGLLYDLMREAKTLRTQARGATPAPDVQADPANLAGALPVAPEAGAVADFGVFLQHAQELAEALRHYEDEEARLILESVNMDIGAGD
jgi:hypothetical protein